MDMGNIVSPPELLPTWSEVQERVTITLEIAEQWLNAAEQYDDEWDLYNENLWQYLS